MSKAFTPFNLVLVITLGMAATVLTALGFEHIGGFIPCALCLEQRIPYYIAAPVGVLALVAMRSPLPPALSPGVSPGVSQGVSRGLVAIIFLLMAWSLVLAIYHSGVEWKFWEGPSGCAASANSTTTNAADLLQQLQDTHGPSCTEAAGRFLGLSFAGWNVLASLLWLGLTAMALKAMFKRG